MAEEANLLVQPQKNKLERSKSEGQSSAYTHYSINNNSVIDSWRASHGSSYHGDRSEGTPAMKQKVIPHYLRPFTGSCHDLCKSDRRLIEEPNHLRSLPKRIGKPPVEIFGSKKLPMSVDKKKVISTKSSVSAASLGASPRKLVRTRSHSIVIDSKISLGSEPPRKNVLPRSKSLNVSLSSTVDVNADKRRNLKVVPSTKDQSSSQKAPRSKPKNDEIFKALTRSLSYHGSNHLGDEKKVAATIKEQKTKYGSDEEDKGETLAGDTRYMDDKPIIPLPTNNKDTKHNGKEIALMLNKTAEDNLEVIAYGNPAMSPGKGIATNSKINDSSLTKTQCRKGRTVELQSANNGPRSLKFKKAKILLVDQDGKADVMKNFNKPIINQDKEDPKSSEVVLRHNSVEDKKDAQGLINNVIEETATKLVQSRKSKVMALVGAFEKIISLQDTKPVRNLSHP